jgi:hypothetical protein
LLQGFLDSLDFVPLNLPVRETEFFWSHDHNLAQGRAKVLSNACCKQAMALIDYLVALQCLEKRQMSASVQVIFGILFVLGYLVSPVTLVWGWPRWMLGPNKGNVASILSLLGFVLSTASALLAISSIIYAQFHRFPFYDPLLLRIFRTGVLLSLGGLVLGLAGVWRTNSLRWHAPMAGIGTLAFWILAAEGE